MLSTESRRGRRIVARLDRGTDLLVRLHTSSDAELELWATHRYLEPFEQLVRKPVHLEMAVALPDEKAQRRTSPSRNASKHADTRRATAAHRQTSRRTGSRRRRAAR